tara:strand:- start:5877 stop:6713 length:837 start_codon:yes stop_codon:yes gene_type:complete
MGNKERPILITGKTGTGKTTMAKSLVSDNHVMYYANEIEAKDWKSLESDIIIEEAHYKANKDIIMNVIRYCKTTIVLTSNNEKDVPSEIKNSCKLRRAGTIPHALEAIKELAPRSEDPKNVEMSVFELVGDFLKNPNRDEVANNLKKNKPADVQIMTWLGLNLHPNKIAFVDGRVKRRWSQKYFYELLAYSHDGRIYSKINYPKRGAYSKVPNILRKLKIKPNQGYLLPQLLQDQEFEEWAKKRLRSDESRVIGMKDRKKQRNAPITPDRTLKLEGWF